MRAFACTVCRRLVPFEAVRCLHCGAELGFEPSRRSIVGMRPDPDGDGLVAVVPEDPDPRYRRCAGFAQVGCNWLVEHAGEHCRSCRLTRTRPADDDAEGVEQWAGVEAAKRRLVFQLLELGIPIREGEHGLRFDLLSSTHEHVVTGHADGLVTLDLAEEDDAHREELRERLSEPYRTVLGHLRHEVGHHLWDVLVRDGPPELLEGSRERFGDEREDYGEALDRHYREGAPDDWPERHVSAYATMHPAEDWAETFAHYLHIWDTLQTAAAFRVGVEGPLEVHEAVPLDAGTIRAPRLGSLDEALEQWLPLTYALNALNRSMGSPDLYPFVLAPAVMEKLAFVDRAVLASSLHVGD